MTIKGNDMKTLLVLILAASAFTANVSEAARYSCTLARQSEPIFSEADCYTKINLYFSKDFNKMTVTSPSCETKFSGLRDSQYAPRSPLRKGASLYKQVLGDSGCFVNAVAMKTLFINSLSTSKENLIFETTPGCGGYFVYKYISAIRL